MTLTDYARAHNLTRQTLYNRLSRAGLKATDLERTPSGGLSEAAIHVLDNLFGLDELDKEALNRCKTFDVKFDADFTPVDAECKSECKTECKTIDVEFDAQRKTFDADLTLVDAKARIEALEGRIADLESTLAFTRDELARAQESLATALMVASQAQQLHAQTQQLQAAKIPENVEQNSPKKPSWILRLLNRQK